MKIWFFILISLLVGCKQQPYSKDYIYTYKEDHLSLQDKVNLLKESSSVKDDALLASIALLYAQNKNFYKAKTAISKAIKINPVEPSYHLYLSKFQADLHNTIDAYNEAKIAFELGAYDVELESFLARMAIETSDSLSGPTFIANYYKSNPENTEAQLLMTQSYLRRHDLLKANNLLEQVIGKDSLNEQVWKTAFEVYYHIDSIALAIEYGNKLLRLESNNGMYYYKIASLYQKKNDLKKAAFLYTKSYQFLPQIETLQLALENYSQLNMLDSILFCSDSLFAGKNYNNKALLIKRARAFDKHYNYVESFNVYNKLIKMDSTDSVVLAEQAIVNRKIAYLQRKKREQQQLADSLVNALPTINF